MVLTSATLAVDGSFAYVKGRLGLRDAEEMRVASEFDFRRQALLYLPRQMPPPKSPSFAEAVAREAIALVTHSQGRAFVLFTSYKVLHAVRPFIEMALPYPVLVQGSAPRSALLDDFRSAGNAVLLATSSFWQGVDVVGDALSCVVIDKLPFASPGDPVTRHASTPSPRGAATPSRTTRCRWRSWLCSRASDGSSGTAAIGGCWPSSTRGCAPWATDGDFWRPCRRRP